MKYLKYNIKNFVLNKEDIIIVKKELDYFLINDYTINEPIIEKIYKSLDLLTNPVIKQSNNLIIAFAQGGIMIKADTTYNKAMLHKLLLCSYKVDRADFMHKNYKQFNKNIRKNIADMDEFYTCYSIIGYTTLEYECKYIHNLIFGQPDTKTNWNPYPLLSEYFNS